MNAVYINLSKLSNMGQVPTVYILGHPKLDNFYFAATQEIVSKPIFLATMRFLHRLVVLLYIWLACITKADLDSVGTDESTVTTTSTPLKLIVEELQDLLNSGKAKEAFEVIQSMDPEHRQEESVLIAYGRALVQLGKMHEGQAVFENILKVNPTSIDANLLMAKLHLRQSSWSAAERHLNSILQEDPQHAMAHSYMSKVALGRDNDSQKALSLVLKAANLSPTTAEIQFDLGMMLFATGSFEDGRRAFEETARLSPVLGQNAAIANVYVQYGQFEWAIEALEKKLKQQYAEGQSPDSATLSLLGELLDSTGRLDDALTYYREALRVDAKNAIAHAGIGLILLGTSKYNYASQYACGLNHKEALDHLQVAYQLDPSMQPVEDALRFCEKEIGEVKFWRNILTTQNAEVSAGSKVTKSGANGVNGLVSTIMQRIVSPANAAKRWLFSHLVRFGLCSESGARSLLPEAVCRLFQVGATARNRGTPSFAESIKDTLRMWAVREEVLPQVPRVTVDSTDELEQLLQLGRPVIITNFQESWGGDESTRFDFSKHALLDKFGVEIVRVSVSETGRFDGPENGTLWGLAANTDVLVRPPQTSMLLGDFITLLERSRRPNSAVHETFYAEYLALHQYLGESFSNLVPWPEFLRKSTMLSHLVSNVWIGGEPTSSPLHYDDYENFLSQVRGVKEITLFPPSDFPNLYYVKRPKGKLQYEYPSTFIRDAEALDKRSYVFGSSVNLDNPDLSLHPRFTQTHPIRATIHPGETLYIPAFWHHEVQSVPVDGESFETLASGSISASASKMLNDPSGDYLNIAVNFWFKNLSMPFAGM